MLAEETFPEPGQLRAEWRYLELIRSAETAIEDAFHISEGKYREVSYATLMRPAYRQLLKAVEDINRLKTFSTGEKERLDDLASVMRSLADIIKDLSPEQGLSLGD
jgi:hypothetical protein